mgnify:CR=1 FL=1
MLTKPRRFLLWLIPFLLLFRFFAQLVVLFLFSQKEKKEAKESERQTQIYAENANQANLATKKLYDELSKYIQHQHAIDAQVELKNKIRSYIAKNQNSRTQCIADFVGLSKEEAFQLLLDMMHTDRTIRGSGRCTVERIDDILWATM